MVILIVLGYVVIGAAELWLWPERPWKKVLTYLCLLTAALILSVLVELSWDLPVPEPLGILQNWLQEL